MATNLQTTLNTHEATIESFFNGWLAHQQALLHKLLHFLSGNDENRKYEKLQLIEEVLAHYEKYYNEKARALSQDGFLLINPPWLTSVEKTFLWVGGVKPSLAFGLVEMLLTSNQIESLKPLKDETSKEEKKIIDELAMVQESVASQPLVNYYKNKTRLVDLDIENNSAEVMQEFNFSMARVVQRADNLRKNTVMEVLEILSVNQKLKFLAAIGKHQLWIRELGLQNEGEHHQS